MPYTIDDIPEAYRAIMESLKYNRGIPLSWLCAVCERTGWDTAFRTTNANFSRSTTRQLGLAGIWWDVAEIIINPIAQWTTCSAGWAGGYRPGAAGTLIRCSYAQPIGASSEQYLMGPVQNLGMATDILLDCKATMETRCGEVNGAIFARWILGPYWYPPKDADGKCIVPPDMLQFVKDEVGALVEFQRLWAEGLGEVPIVPRPVDCQPPHVIEGGQCMCPSAVLAACNATGGHVDPVTCECLAGPGPTPGGGAGGIWVLALIALAGGAAVIGYTESQRKKGLRV